MAMRLGICKNQVQYCVVRSSRSIFWSGLAWAGQVIWNQLGRHIDTWKYGWCLRADRPQLGAVHLTVRPLSRLLLVWASDQRSHTMSSYKKEVSYKNPHNVITKGLIVIETAAKILLSSFPSPWVKAHWVCIQHSFSMEWLSARLMSLWVAISPANVTRHTVTMRLSFTLQV